VVSTTQKQESMLLIRRSAASVGLLLLFVLGLSVSFGVPVSVMALTLCVLVAQILPGVLVMRTSDSPTTEEQFGIGAVVGVVLSTLCHIILLELTGTRLGFLLPLVLVPILWVRNGQVETKRSPGGISTFSKESIMPFAIALFFLSRDFRWLFLPSVIAISCVLLVRSSFGTVIAMLSFVLLSVVSWQQRPIFWWFIADDLQAFESISYHFLESGSRDPLGPLGTLGSRYHVFTYQWSGILSRFSHAEPYIILNRVLPILISFGTSFLVWVFLKGRTSLSFLRRSIAAVLFAVFVNFSYVSPSYVLGIMILLAGYLFWTSTSFTRILTRYVLSCALALAMALTKSSNIPVIVFGLSTLLLWSILSRQSNARIHFTDSIGAATALLLYAILYLFDVRTTRQISSFRLFGYAKQVVPEIASVVDRPTRVVALVLVTTGLLWVPLISVFALRMTKQLRSPEALFALGVVPFAVIMALVSGNQANGYFVSSGLNLVHLVGLASLVGTFDMRLSVSQKLIGVTASVLVVAATLGSRWVTTVRNGGSVTDVWFRIIESSLILPIAVGMAVFSLVRLVVRGNSWQAHAFLRAALSVALLTAGTREVTLVQRLEKGPELRPSESDQALGSMTEQDIIRVIDDLLPSHAVLASNRFCGTQCQGTAWFDRDLALMGDDFNLPETPSGFGGRNFRISAESRRRVLIEGPYWLLINGYPADDARERMSISLDFAETASDNSRQRLRDFGVTYFLLHLPSRVSALPVGDYGTVIERNRDFVLLKI